MSMDLSQPAWHGDGACGERHRFRQADRLWDRRADWLLPPANLSENVNSVNENANKESDEVEDKCRICREGATAERPLYWPCKCRGSVRFVHEDCLVAWRTSSRTGFSFGSVKFACELCRQEFSFRKVYRPGAPESRSVSVFSSSFVLGIGRRVLRASRSLLLASARLGLVLFLWAFSLPVLTAWVFRLSAYGSAGRVAVLGSSASVGNVSTAMAVLMSLANRSAAPNATDDSSLVAVDELGAAARLSANGTDVSSSSWWPSVDPLSLVFDAFMGVMLCLFIVASALALGSIFDWLCEYFETRGVRIPHFFESFRAPHEENDAAEEAPAPVDRHHAAAGAVPPAPAIQHAEGGVIAARDHPAERRADLVDGAGAGVGAGAGAGAGDDGAAAPAGMVPEPLRENLAPAGAREAAAQPAENRAERPPGRVPARGRRGARVAVERAHADAAGDDVLRLDELVGLTGPLSAVFERYFTIMIVIATIFASCVFFPRMIGIAAFHIIRGIRSWLVAPESLDLAYPAFSRMLVLGYASLLAITVLTLTIVRVVQKLRISAAASERGTVRQRVSFLAFLMVYIKVLVLIAVEAVIFPLVVGGVVQMIAFSIDLNRSFGSSADDAAQRPLMVVLPTPNAEAKDVAILPLGLHEPAAHMFARAANSTIGHSVVGSDVAANFVLFVVQNVGFLVAIGRWLLGFATLYQLSHAVSYIRRKTRTGLLWFFRNPEDPEFDPINEMIEYSVERHVARIAMSTALYAVVLLLWVYVPVQIWTGNPAFVRHLPTQLARVLTVAPFDLRLRDVHDVPLDLLVLHVLLPFCVQHIKPVTRALTFAYRLTFHSAASLLGLHDYIHGRPDDVVPRHETTEEAQVRINRLKPARFFRLRIVAFLLVIFASAFATVLLGFSVPVWCGRTALSLTAVAVFGDAGKSTHPLAQPLNDLYAVVVGIFILHSVASLAAVLFDVASKIVASIQSSVDAQAVEVHQPEAGADAQGEVRREAPPIRGTEQGTRALLIRMLGASAAWGVLLSFWFGLIPYLLGTFLELAVAVPIRVGVYECPVLHPWQAWLMGLLLHQLWVRTVFFTAHFHLDGDGHARGQEQARFPFFWQCFVDMSSIADTQFWLARLERVYADGFMGIRFIQSFKEAVAPPVIVFGSMLALPHACGWSISTGVLWLTEDLPDLDALHVVSIAQRLSWLVALCMVVVVLAVRFFLSSVRTMQREIADDLYLVGTRLGNRE